ncbi:hypothetical protein [Ideonella sp. BN130291]|uniref:hypothetical protein n=1 Tax=Ideonella sp. BN130291 TaxID=3112940 RepID=UPI002E26FD27|nr:hypothetical protein [Ideonella sp. BN130291]
MTAEDELDVLKGRIAKAETEMEAWRASGPQEKYLEAFCNVESLENRLDQLLRARAPGAAPDRPLAAGV